MPSNTDRLLPAVKLAGVSAALAPPPAPAWAMVAMLGVDPLVVPTVAQSLRLGVCPAWDEIVFPRLTPEGLQVADWQLPAELMPIDFGMPRVVKSTFKHLYIRFIKEPMTAYAGRL
jgi:uncharacterized protein (DUF362 family)